MKKRAFGYIQQRGNSVMVRYRHDGKRHIHTLPPGSTRKDAERYLERMRLEIYTGTWIRPDTATFAEFLAEWLERRDNASPSTDRIYRANVKRLCPAAGIGGVKLQALTINHAERAKQALAKTISPSTHKLLKPKTINDILNMARTACNWAIDHDLMIRNPFGRGLGRQARPKPEKRSLTMPETQKLLAALKAEGAPYGTFLAAALLTAQRAGSELCGLRWQDVDLEARTFTISQVWLQRSKEFVPAGNFKHKRRTLPLPAEVADLLRKQWLWQEQMRRWRATQEFGIQWTEDPRFQDLVFTTTSGEPLARNTFMYQLRRICQAAGVPVIAPHELRHTGVSLLISLGYGVKHISDLCGHTSVRTTLDIYGHAFPSDVLGAMDALGAALTKEAR